MLEGQYNPPWAQGYPALMPLTPLLGVHSIQEEHPSEHFLSFGKAMKAEASESPKKTD